MIPTWPEGRVPYCVGDDVPPLTRTRLQRAIDAWNGSGVPVTVQPRTAKDCSFVTFRRGRLSSSPRGRLGGEQAVELSPDAWYGVMMHEIGHTIGLTHEHNRPDRDDHIEVRWANIRKSALSQFQPRDEPVPEHPYDFASIMHYAQMAYSWNDQPTIRIRAELPPGVLVGQRRRLSQGDIRRIKDLYPTPSAP